jgi:hypothetical protein
MACVPVEIGTEYLPNIRQRKNRNAYRALVRNPEGKRRLGRFRSRWKNVKREVKEVDGDADQIHLAQNTDQRRPIVDTAMDLWVS